MSADYLHEVMSARWTADELCREKDRRLAEDLAAIGPRPGWWRPVARRRYDRSVRLLEKDHHADLCEMLAIQDPMRRAIMGHLIGWKPASPKEHASD